MNSKLLQLMNVIAVLGTILLNAMANIIPFNNVNTGQVSDAYPNLFTPPGYVFAIWGAIYTLIFAFMVYQVRSSQREKSYLHAIGPLYLIGAIVNIAWLILFHFSYGNPTLFLVTPVMIGLFLVILLWTYIRVGIGTAEVPRGEKLAVHLPLSVYLGWISLATIANIASALNIIFPGIPLDTQALWTALIIVVALVLTMLMLVKRRDVAYGLVVIWASVGIATKQAAYSIIYMTALGAVIVIILAILLLPFIMKKNPKDFYLAKN
ncbi:MAG: TspO/MBR family protein [Candidatus Thorarchaeota archaeon]